MNVFDVSNKLNLRSSDYVANVFASQELLTGLLQSCKGLVAVDDDKNLSRLRKMPELKGLKFVDCFRSDLDENAYDKIVCSYDEDCFNNNSALKTLEMLYRATDRGGSVLIVGVPHGRSKRSLVDYCVAWAQEKNLSQDDVWVFENSDNPNLSDILFKVKKD